MSVEQNKDMVAAEDSAAVSIPHTAVAEHCGANDDLGLMRQLGVIPG